MQTFRPINEISRKHSKNGLMQSGRKRCTRRTAAPAGAGIAPGSGADERRGCTSPLCVRTQNPKPWYELPMSGDQISPPRRRPASADSADLCGDHRSADKRGAGGRDRHRTSQCKTQTQKHPTASPNAGCGRRQRRTPPCRRHMSRQFRVRTHIPKIQNTLRPYK